MKPDTFDQLKQLMDQALVDADKAFSKQTTSRARSSRKALMEITKLCKVARKQLLDDVINAKKNQED